MPVVTITAPAVPDAAAQSVADAVADALGLGPGDVLAASVQSRATVGSGGVATADWPIATIRGSDRGADAVTRARVAAEDAVRRAWDAAGLEVGGVWVEWVLPEPRR